MTKTVSRVARIRNNATKAMARAQNAADKARSDNPMMSDEAIIEMIDKFSADHGRVAGAAQKIALFLSAEFDDPNWDLWKSGSMGDNRIPQWKRLKAIQKEIEDRAINRGNDPKSAWQAIKNANAKMMGRNKDRDPQSYEVRIAKGLKPLYRAINKDENASDFVCDLMDRIGDILVALKVDISKL